MATKSTKSTTAKSTKTVNSAKPTTPKSSNSKFTTTKSVATKPVSKTTATKTAIASKTKPATKSLSLNEILNLYKKKSGYGDHAAVASLTGYSREHISNIKNGHRNINQKVADAMFAVVNK